MIDIFQYGNFSFSKVIEYNQRIQLIIALRKGNEKDQRWDGWKRNLQRKIARALTNLDTVAGDALSILCGSKIILQFGAIGIRSPLASVSVLLSSNTEFKFSIQIASTGPSKTIQTCSL